MLLRFSNSSLLSSLINQNKNEVQIGRRFKVAFCVTHGDRSHEFMIAHRTCHLESKQALFCFINYFAINDGGNDIGLGVTSQTRGEFKVPHHFADIRKMVNLGSGAQSKTHAQNNNSLVVKPHANLLHLKNITLF